MSFPDRKQWLNLPVDIQVILNNLVTLPSSRDIHPNSQDILHNNLDMYPNQELLINMATLFSLVMVPHSNLDMQHPKEHNPMERHLNNQVMHPNQEPHPNSLDILLNNLVMHPSLEPLINMATPFRLVMGHLNNLDMQHPQ